ncbi:O-methyltransferase [Natronomonas salsuginis]|uniref:O-methyltransferase n=1 Tax=Natronomonas salsuginis TaxID=2217661 RepID=A0A4U5JGZ1_9EURY|nr:O-methyltransferase [Natronomonas salsuginis]TKR28125.1 O-methyltransferase [Natronomonas salsuginis]
MAVPDAVEAFAATVGPEPDEVLVEMDRRAEETGFPTVGPAIGGWLQQLAGLLGAKRVFEFGSGFGYSAYWFLRGMNESGQIVLTEIDSEELDDARRNLERGGVAGRARFEHGDAIEIIDEYDGPFDIALIDNEKRRYTEAFEAIRSKIPIGGIVVADNAVRGPFEFEALSALVDDVDADGIDDPNVGAARGVAAYLDHVRSADAFETTLLPLGEGLAVSRRVA